MMRADRLASLHRTLGLGMGLRNIAVLGLGDTHIAFWDYITMQFLVYPFLEANTISYSHVLHDCSYPTNS
jgi:hypothetical protein